MKKQSALGVFVWSVVTFGIYVLIWLHRTKQAMNERGEQIPTMWWIIIPFANIWWQWKYSEAFARATARAHNKMSPLFATLLALFVPLLAAPIFQDIINSAADVTDAEQIARARIVS